MWTCHTKKYQRFENSCNIPVCERFFFLFLILCTTGVDEQNDGCLNIVPRSFQHCRNFTFELPIRRTIKYLDLAMEFKERYVCWRYKALSGKGFLSFNSESSNTVKQAAASTALSFRLKMSREHQMTRTFDTYVSRRQDAGYPQQIFASIRERICPNVKKTDDHIVSTTQKDT